MRKILIVTALFVFVLSGSSFGAPITLTNVITFNSAGASSSGDGTASLTSYGRGSVNLLNGTGDYVKWTQAFTFNPIPENKTVEGRLSLRLRDDSNNWLDGPEFAIGWTNTGAWSIGEVDTRTYNYNVSLQNGALTVTLASLGGDFYIDSSTLTVNYNAATPVPEPASMVLVGLGMLSVGFLARKRNKLHN
jgi:hypothetical protein